MWRPSEEESFHQKLTVLATLSQTSWLFENNFFYCLNHPVYGIWLWQSKKTKTYTKHILMLREKFKQDLDNQTYKHNIEEEP